MQLVSGPIPIRVHPFFWALAAILGWMNTESIPLTLVWIVIIFVSVLIHEFGHALTAIAFGQRADIELTGFGGLTQRRGGKLALWKEFIIVLNGPLAGLALALCAYAAFNTMKDDKIDSYLEYTLYITAAVNVFWTIINLLPIQPLDGGRLLQIILEAIFGLRGIKIALFISLLIAATVGAYFFSIGFLLGGAILFLLAFENYRGWKEVSALTTHDQDDAMQKQFREAEEDYHAGKPEAVEKMEAIRTATGVGMIYQAASEYLADMLSTRGRHQEAYEVLQPIKKKLSPGAFALFHYVAYKSGKWDEAIDLGSRSYQNLPNAETALINALCHALKGEAQPAVGWLECAVREGLPNLREALEKREFDFIRTTPQFKELEGKN